MIMSINIIYSVHYYNFVDCYKWFGLGRFDWFGSFDDSSLHCCCYVVKVDAVVAVDNAVVKVGGPLVLLLENQIFEIR